MVTKRSLYYWVFKGNARLQALLVGIILITVAMRILPLEMQKRIINQAIGMGDFEALVLYCGLYIAAVISAGVLKYAINLLQGWIGNRTLMRMRRELYEHILSLPLPFFRKTSPGLVISSVMTELESMAAFVGSGISAPVVNILTFLGFAGYMFWLNPLLAGLSIAVYPIEMLFIPWLQRWYNTTNRQRTSAIRDLSGKIGESVSGISEVHGNASVALEGKRFGKGLEGLYKLAVRLNALKFGIKFVNNFFQSLGPFILFLVGGYLAINGRFDLGALVAFLSAYEKVYDPWKELMEFYQLWQDSKVRYKQVMDYFDYEPEVLAVPQGREPYTFKGEISVKDAVYDVGGNIRLVDKISMTVKPGEHVALVGFSGSGKSTLARLVSQHYKYTGGSVMIDGHEVKDLTRLDVISNMGVVAQQPFIFDGTIYENLVYGCEALVVQGADKSRVPDLDRVIEVLQQVGLFADVLRFSLRAVLDKDSDNAFRNGVIRGRSRFQELHGAELEHDIEQFDESRFMMYGSMAENLLFGTPLTPEWQESGLPANKQFRALLEKEDLFAPLLQLGQDLLTRTVDIIGSASADSELFEKSPVPQERYEEAQQLARKLRDVRRAAELSEQDVQALLRIAFTYLPARHKIVPLPGHITTVLPQFRTVLREELENNPQPQIAFYNRESYLRGQSVLDNIVYGHVKADSAGAEERIYQRVMQLLIVEGVLEQMLRLGLEFRVGSMGDRLSGGQQQKVALARAFLKEPPILVLDEATSALDNASQSRIQNLLERKWKGHSTVLSVVHRLDTLKGYDRIAVLKAGRIIEHGSWNELMERKGALYGLVHKGS
ncbi:ABC transporter ATP-binding protein/permease [Oleidesulfovibrio sp.]|uniref:ABC transporter ATP-binding protein/permease n=1 Tax=Oleidesulfovibrio sp. TaxID=2909707 RepID=UPI003A851C9D